MFKHFHLNQIFSGTMGFAFHKRTRDHITHLSNLGLYRNIFSSIKYVFHFHLILASWLWRRRFVKIFFVFLLFCYYLPLERGYPLLLKTLVSVLSQDDLCPVWLKLAQWFWKRCLNYPTLCLNFYDYLPFEEDLALYLNTLESPSPKDNLYNLKSALSQKAFMKILAIMAQWFSRKKKIQ